MNRFALFVVVIVTFQVALAAKLPSFGQIYFTPTLPAQMNTLQVCYTSGCRYALRVTNLI